MRNQVELARRLLESKGFTVEKVDESGRWQFKVTTNYDNRPTETEFFTANSEEEIQQKYQEYLKNKGDNEEVSEPFPITESNNPNETNKFKVGDIVEFSMLYGGSVTAKVVSRTEDTVTLKETWTSEDSGDDVSKDTTYDVHEYEGVEYLVVWEYRGHKGQVFPPNSEFAN